MKPLFSQATMLVCLGAALCGAHASEHPLTLSAATQRALENHPALGGFAAQRASQQGRSDEARLRPAPSIDLNIEDFAGSGARQGFDGSQTTLSLSQVLQFGRQRDRRIDRAQAKADLLVNEQDVMRRDVLAELAVRFVATLAHQQRVEASRKGVELARRMADVVQERVQAAAAPDAERARARVELAEAELRHEEYAHQLQVLRMALAEAMGLESIDFGPLDGELFKTELTVSFAALMTWLDQAPELRQLISRRRLIESELMLARSRARGEVRASVGVRQRQSSDDTAWVAGLSVPLFSARQAAPNIATHQAKLEALRFEQTAHRNAIRAQLFSLDQELRHAKHVLQVQQSTVLPALNSALGLTEQAYRNGRYSWLQLKDIQQQVLMARLNQIAAAEEFHITRIEIERLTGQNLADVGEAQ